jgi:hypothetical protein
MESIGLPRERTRALRASIAIAMSVCFVLCGCAGPTRRSGPETQVAYKAVDAPDGARYELREQENSTIPAATAATPPVYPPTMIARKIDHVGVRAKLIVDTEGNVSEVRFEQPQGSTWHAEAFDDAVRTAVLGWRFAPLRIQEWEDVLDDEGNVADSRMVKDEAKPFSLDYEFSFDLRDGSPVVATTQTRAK